MNPASQGPVPDFLQRFEAGSTGILYWEQLERLWTLLRDRADGGWYVYAVGDTVPVEPVSAEDFRRFIDEVDTLLRQDHDEDYCGIVYVDDREAPEFVKIFDPNNLGSSCGSSGLRVLPGWVLSRVPPVDLEAAMPPTGSRRRWWQRLFGGAK
ncbi:MULTISPECIES: hypothetical protein [unclassified Thioalkalivibrio]|uniref:hypothetical protein n=1 Tax=unclassified Thioalkalivibrio TaxID=2621013 RepID=UPI0003A6D8D6|nr:MULTISPECIES: hypothetical protein [unclassified Thioalkalivibrio]